MGSMNLYKNFADKISLWGECKFEWSVKIARELPNDVKQDDWDRGNVINFP